jgi:hypothetical protein
MSFFKKQKRRIPTPLLYLLILNDSLQLLALSAQRYVKFNIIADNLVS